MGVSVIEAWVRLSRRPDATRLVHQSSNGDQWLLAKGPEGDVFVVHIPNASSGGHMGRAGLGSFLSGPDSPQKADLVRLMGTLVDAAPAGEQAS